jgi:hypothetical protein
MSIYQDPAEEGILLAECIEEIQRLKSRNTKLEQLAVASKSLERSLLSGHLPTSIEYIVWGAVLSELDEP